MGRRRRRFRPMSTWRQRQQQLIFFKAAMAGGGKTCEAVPADKCGIKTGYNTCLKCAADATYTCEECCPGLNKVSKDGYTYCIASKPGPPSPPSSVRTPYPKSYLRPGQKAD